MNFDAYIKTGGPVCAVDDGVQRTAQHCRIGGNTTAVAALLAVEGPHRRSVSDGQRAHSCVCCRPVAFL